MKTNIEAEGGELVLRNSIGDIAIIPRDEVPNVKYFLGNGQFEEIDNLVGRLPSARSYAEEGLNAPISSSMNDIDDEIPNMRNNAIEKNNVLNRVIQDNTAIPNNQVSMQEENRIQAKRQEEWDRNIKLVEKEIADGRLTEMSRPGYVPKEPGVLGKTLGISEAKTLKFWQDRGLSYLSGGHAARTGPTAKQRARMINQPNMFTTEEILQMMNNGTTK